MPGARSLRNGGALHRVKRFGVDLGLEIGLGLGLGSSEGYSCISMSNKWGQVGLGGEFCSFSPQSHGTSDM